MRLISRSQTGALLVEENDLALPEDMLGGIESSNSRAIVKDECQGNTFWTNEELAAQSAIMLIGGKWRIPVLRHLQNGPVHFGELKRRLSPVSKKVLNQLLKQMSQDGLIHRTERLGTMPRVEYSLAYPLGHAVLDLLQTVAEWGDKHSETLKSHLF